MIMSAFSGVNAPTSQSLLNYILLTLVYGGIMIYKRQHLTVHLCAAFYCPKDALDANLVQILILINEKTAIICYTQKSPKILLDFPDFLRVRCVFSASYPPCPGQG
jgi:hypothetical protein